VDIRTVRKALVFGFFLAAAAVTGAQAQFTVAAQSGLAFPIVRSADYFEPGPAFGVLVGYGVHDRIDLVGNGGLDLWKGLGGLGTPDMNLLRFEAGVRAYLVGERGSGANLQLVATAGATSFGSSEFTRRTTPPLDPDLINTYNPIIGPATFSKTYGSATAGFRVGFFSLDSGLEGSFGVDVHYSPMSTDDTDLLRDARPLTLRELNSAVSLPITLSIGYAL